MVNFVGLIFKSIVVAEAIRSSESNLSLSNHYLPMDIPEWEIRDAVCWNPDLLDTEYDLKLVDFQVPVRVGSNERYMDVLFDIKDESKKDYLILELKKDVATEKAVEQVLEYRKLFCKRNYRKKNEVEAMVAAPEVLSNARTSEVKTSEVDVEEVHSTHPRGEVNKEELASKLREISEKNPLFAHELNQGREPREFNKERSWLWMFYTILDGGGPAQTFIKAYESMKRKGVHRPEDMIELKEEKGFEESSRSLLPHLRKATLFNPGRGGVINYAKALIEAAELLEEHEYSFKKLYEYNEKLNEIKNTLSTVTFMKSNESRRKKQFIRGMVLRGSWKYPREDEYFFEKPSQSTHIMNVSRRLGMIDSDDVKRFNEDHLGDYMVLSHSLWVLGKKYCSTSSRPQCNRCRARSSCPSNDSFKAKPIPNVGLDKWIEE